MGSKLLGRPPGGWVPTPHHDELVVTLRVNNNAMCNLGKGTSFTPSFGLNDHNDHKVVRIYGINDQMTRVIPPGCAPDLTPGCRGGVHGQGTGRHPAVESQRAVPKIHLRARSLHGGVMRVEPGWCRLDPRFVSAPEA